MSRVSLKEILIKSGIKTTQYYAMKDYLTLSELAEAIEGDSDKAELFLLSYY